MKKEFSTNLLDLLKLNINLNLIDYVLVYNYIAHYAANLLFSFVR